MSSITLLVTRSGSNLNDPLVYYFDMLGKRFGIR
jgi:hypothetical protein